MHYIDTILIFAVVIEKTDYQSSFTMPRGFVWNHTKVSKFVKKRRKCYGPRSRFVHRRKYDGLGRRFGNWGPYCYHRWKVSNAAVMCTRNMSEKWRRAARRIEFLPCLTTWRRIDSGGLQWESDRDDLYTQIIGGILSFQSEFPSLRFVALTGFVILIKYVIFWQHLWQKSSVDYIDSISSSNYVYPAPSCSKISQTDLSCFRYGTSRVYCSRKHSLLMIGNWRIWSIKGRAIDHKIAVAVTSLLLVLVHFHTLLRGRFFRIKICF